MSRHWLRSACALLALGGVAAAQQVGFNQADVHDPNSPRYTPMVGGGLTNFAFGAGPGGLAYSYYSPGYFTAGWNAPYPLYPYAAPVPFFYPRFIPLTIPGEALYGPMAMQRFMGTYIGPPVPGPGAIAPPSNAAPGFGVLAPHGAPVEKAPAKPRATNADARARSQRFIVLGDGYFAKQAYSEAYQRYKLAIQAAPDMADGFLRQGFTQIALGRYDAAARSFKRGIALSPNWADSGFRLDTLYAGAGLAKAAHIEALAQECVRAPSSDALFLLGVMLFFDGQPDRSAPFFQRSAELSGGDDAHLDGFLRQFVPAEAVEPAEANDAPGPAGAVAGNRKPGGGAKPTVVPVARPAAGSGLFDPAVTTARKEGTTASPGKTQQRTPAAGVLMPPPRATPSAAPKPARDL